MCYMNSYKLLPIKNSKLTLFSKLAFVLGIMLLVVGLGIAFRDARTNRLENIAAAKLIAEANRKVANSSIPIAAITSTSVPATTKPAVAAVAVYIVPPEKPRYLLIPKLGVDARVISVGLDALGALKTPANIYDTAWFNQSALPGQVGSMLIDGHVSSWTAHGVFHDLKKLLAGDVMKIQRGDDTVFNYEVVKVQLYNADNVDMVAAMVSIDPSKPGLNLISCAGDVISGTNDFNQRIIVFAVLI